MTLSHATYTLCISGITALIAEHPELVNDTMSAEVCRKDTGEQRKVRNWSRGFQFLISGGGHIEAFTPLYV